MNASSHPEFPVGGVRFISNCCVYRTASQHLRPDEKARHVELILLVTLKAFVTGHSLSSQRTRSRVSGRSRAACGSVARPRRLDRTRRVFVYASLHTCTHYCLSSLSLSLPLCALRVFRGHLPPPCACCMQLLRAALCRIESSHLARPHEVGVGGAGRLGSLNGADQAPTA